MHGQSGVCMGQWGSEARSALWRNGHMHAQRTQPDAFLTCLLQDIGIIMSGDRNCQRAAQRDRPAASIPQPTPVPMLVPSTVALP